MFVGDKFIIAGKYFDENVDDYLGILSICNSSEENIV